MFRVVVMAGHGVDDVLRGLRSRTCGSRGRSRALPSG